MTENSVIILGISLENFPDIEAALIHDRKIEDLLYEEKVMCLGLDEQYWAIGSILSTNEEDYVKEVDINILNPTKEDKLNFLTKLKKINEEVFDEVSCEDVKIYHTQQY